MNTEYNTIQKGQDREGRKKDQDREEGLRRKVDRPKETRVARPPREEREQLCDECATLKTKLPSRGSVFLFLRSCPPSSVGRSRLRAKEVALKVHRCVDKSRRYGRTRTGEVARKTRTGEKDQGGRTDGTGEHGRRVAERCEGGHR